MVRPMWLRVTADNATAQFDFTTNSCIHPISRQNICSADLFFCAVAASAANALVEAEDWPCERNVPAAAGEANARRCERICR